MTTAIVLIIGAALLVGLIVILQRRRSDQAPSRDVPHTEVRREGGHQGRSPGADGGGHSYGGGGS